MDKSIPDRRQFSRIAFDAGVSLQQDGSAFDAQLLDISFNGVLISTPANYELRADSPCTITVTLADDVSIVMQGTLVHSSSATLGFHCTSIDMDSMTHLRRLIEVNFAGEATSERVLNEMLMLYKASYS